MSKEDAGTKTLQRAFTILNAFNDNDRILTLTEISKRTELPKSTVHRLLDMLDKQGVVIHESEGRGYCLGYQLIHWGNLAQNCLDIRTIALPILNDLSNSTSETSVLSVRHGYFGVWIEMVESTHPVRLSMRIGKPLSLHAGASSKVLWAFLPDAEIEEILETIELTPVCSSTITDKKLMRQELAAIRSRGYATSIEETDAEAFGIAAPVYNHAAKLIAGIGIVAPLARLNQENMILHAEKVKKAGTDLSKMLGWKKERV
jgi:IclR family transcriptional regulator, KDG regulon repressor